MNPYIKQYQKNQFETASRGEILVLLYNGAIQYLHMAKKAMAEGNINDTHNNIMGAQRIINEFQTTLDRKKGAELAQNLSNLYDYMRRLLIEANVHKKMENLDEVLEHMKGLRDAWSQAVENAKLEKLQGSAVEGEESESHDWSVGDEE